MLRLDNNYQPSNYIIRAYTDDSVTVNDEELRSSFIVMSDRLIKTWRPNHISELEPQDLHRLIDLDPELIIIGSGSSLVFPDPTITSDLLQKGIGFEVMDTFAACRCYNILLSEGRNVAAGLILDEFLD